MSIYVANLAVSDSIFFLAYLHFIWAYKFQVFRTTVHVMQEQFWKPDQLCRGVSILKEYMKTGKAEPNSLQPYFSPMLLVYEFQFTQYFQVFWKASVADLLSTIASVITIDATAARHSLVVSNVTHSIKNTSEDIAEIVQELSKSSVNLPVPG
jgi:hypothetical protein